MKITHNEFTLSIFNENFKNFVEVNGAHLFGLKSLVENCLTLSNDKSIDLSSENAALVDSFLSENTSRELMEFDTYEQAREAYEATETAGKMFTQDGFECFYQYSK